MTDERPHWLAELCATWDETMRWIDADRRAPALTARLRRLFRRPDPGPRNYAEAEALPPPCAPRRVGDGGPPLVDVDAIAAEIARRSGAARDDDGPVLSNATVRAIGDPHVAALAREAARRRSLDVGEPVAVVPIDPDRVDDVRRRIEDLERVEAERAGDDERPGYCCEAGAGETGKGRPCPWHDDDSVALGMTYRFVGRRPDSVHVDDPAGIIDEPGPIAAAGRDYRDANERQLHAAVGIGARGALHTLAAELRDAGHPAAADLADQHAARFRPGADRAADEPDPVDEARAADVLWIGRSAAEVIAGRLRDAGMPEAAAVADATAKQYR